MSECKHEWKYVREDIVMCAKCNAFSTDELQKERDELRAQVAVLRGALEEVRKGHIESKFDNDDGRFVEVFVRDVHIVIDQALEQTPEEATEIVSKLAENMVMKALAEWRRDKCSS